MKKEKRKAYYQKNKYEICKKTIGEYADNSIERMNEINRNYIQQLYKEYPFEDYAVRCIKRVCIRFGIKRDSYLYDECFSIGAKAYMYSIGRCSVKKVNEQLIRGYLYVVTRVFIICVLNTYDQSKQICKENGFKQISSDDYRV